MADYDILYGICDMEGAILLVVLVCNIFSYELCSNLYQYFGFIGITGLYLVMSYYEKPYQHANGMTYERSD